MPSITDIVASVSVPRLIKDPIIKNAHFIQSPRGGNKKYVGGFSVVFPCEVNGETWAFRCWHADIGNVRERYEKFSKALNDDRLPYFCDFVYVDKGICVNGQIYPTTRMRWVNGVNLKTYICQNSTNKTKLRKLAADFLQMCRDLHSHHFSHGDLQHGNIMADASGNLFIIDYDSIYHSSMGRMSDNISGLKDYQHPNRRKNQYATEKVDYFSELIIYTSIAAIAQDASLVKRYNVENTKALLFQFNDFTNFSVSPIYKDLWNLGDEFHILLQAIKNALALNDINDITPIEDLFAPAQILEFIVPTKAAYGSTVIVKWRTENAVKVFLNSKEYEPNGQCQISIKKDTTITLRVIGNNGKEINISKGIAVDTKTIPPTIKTFHILSTINYGEKFEIEWKVENAKTVTINGREVNAYGKITDSITKDTQYILSAVSVYGVKITQELNARVYKGSYPAEIKMFDVPSVCSYGKSICIRWQVSNASKVTLNGEKVTTKGEKVKRPKQDLEFTLTAQNFVGKITTITKKVTIDPATCPPKFCSVTAPQMVDYGETATIQWETAYTTRVLLDGKVLAASGQYTTPPILSNTDFEIQGESDNGKSVLFPISININPDSYPVKIKRFVVNKTSVEWGEEVTLQWETMFPCTAYINGIPQKGKKHTAVIQADTTFTLVCRNNKKQEDVQTLHVKCGKKPETPKVLKFDVPNRSKFAIGESAELAWEISPATAVFLDGMRVANQGVKKITIKQHNIYGLTAYNGNVKEERVLTFTAYKSPTIWLHCKATTIRITKGEKLQLKWEIENAEYATLNGTPISLFGEKSILIRKTQDIVFSAYNHDLRTERIVHVVAVEPLPTIKLFRAPAVINYAEEFSIEWNVVNAQSITINGENVANAGSLTYSITQDTEITLLAVNKDGIPATRSVNIRVFNGSYPAHIQKFNISRPTIPYGESAFLQWEVTNAVTTTLNGRKVEAKGKQEIFPTQDAEYTLIAKNALGNSVSVRKKVVVYPTKEIVEEQERKEQRKKKVRRRLLWLGILSVLIFTGVKLCQFVFQNNDESLYRSICNSPTTSECNQYLAKYTTHKKEVTDIRELCQYSDDIKTKLSHAEKENIAPIGDAIATYQRMRKKNAHHKLTENAKKTILDKINECYKANQTSLKECLGTCPGMGLDARYRNRINQLDSYQRML